MTLDYPLSYFYSISGSSLNVRLSGVVDMGADEKGGVPETFAAETLLPVFPDFHRYHPLPFL